MSIKRLRSGDRIKLSFIRCLALAGFLAYLPAARCITILDFFDTSGGQATGQLILGEPFNQNQVPLPGSFFDVDGVGPLPSFGLGNDLGFRWLGANLRTVVGEGRDDSWAPGLNVQLVLFPTTYFNENYNLMLTDPTGHITITQYSGDGHWAIWMPDAANTSFLLAMSSAVLALVARRVGSAAC